MNRREHSHLASINPERQSKPGSTYSHQKREPPKSRCDPSLRNSHPAPGPAELCRPRFSFFFIQLSKNRYRRHGIAARFHLKLQRPIEVAHAARLISSTRELRSELLGRQRRAALVVEAYIGPTLPNCQRPFSPFLNFLRQQHATPTGRCGSWQNFLKITQPKPPPHHPGTQPNPPNTTNTIPCRKPRKHQKSNNYNILDKTHPNPNAESQPIPPPSQRFQTQKAARGSAANSERL